MEYIIPFATALFAGVIGAWTTFLFSLRQDREARRRERIVSHSIDAYRNLESSVGQEELTPDQKSRFESSIAAIFLLGSKKSAKAASDFTIGVVSGDGGKLKSLLMALRSDLRRELGLEAHELEIPIFRFTSDVRSQ